MSLAAPRQGGAIIFLTFMAAIMLAIIPLPNWMESIRPAWAALAVIYWCIALPDRVGVVSGWLIGLFLDVASGALLGQNAFTLAFVAYLSLKLHLRIRLFPIWQMALSVLVLVALYQMLTLWIKGFTGQSSQNWSYWLPSLSSMVIWPFFYAVLRSVRRFYRVR